MLLLLAACAGHDLDPELVPSPHVASAFRVELDAPRGTARVWWSDGEDHAGPPTPVDGPSRLPLLGLPAGERVRWWVEVEGEDGQLHASGTSTLTVPQTPYDLPEFVLQVDRKPARLHDGYVLASRFDDPSPSHVVVLDGRGRVVWWQGDEGKGRITRVRPSLDGTGVLFLQEDRLVEQSFDGFTRRETAVRDTHHDLRELGDGTALVLEHDVVHGRILGYGEADYLNDRLVRVTLGDDDPTHAEDLFSWEDDYPVSPWAPCAHVADTDFFGGAHEWVHANSLLPAPDGGWWVHMRWLDGLVRLDADGSYVDQVGGRDGTWTFDPGAEFHHAHLSWAEIDGAVTRLWVFDNGSDHTVPIERTRLLEVELDEATRHVTLLSELDDPMGFGHVNFLGDVTPVPDSDHVLTSWAGRGAIAELDADGDVVWGVQMHGGAVGRLHPLATLYPPTETSSNSARSSPADSAWRKPPSVPSAASESSRLAAWSSRIRSSTVPSATSL